MASYETAPLRLVSKSDAGTKAVLDRWNLWIGTDGQWQRLQPKCCCRIGLAFRRNVCEKLRRVTVIGPSQSQIQRQVLADLPVIATIDKGIVLTEVEHRD